MHYYKTMTGDVVAQLESRSVPIIGTDAMEITEAEFTALAQAQQAEMARQQLELEQQTALDLASLSAQVAELEGAIMELAGLLGGAE